jgi:hypothetical protein
VSEGDLAPAIGAKQVQRHGTGWADARLPSSRRRFVAFAGQPRSEATWPSAGCWLSTTSVLAKEDDVRATTAFNRMLRLPGASVIDIGFGGEGVIVTVRLRRRRRVCSGCGQLGGQIHGRRVKRWRHLDLGSCRCVIECNLARKGQRDARTESPDRAGPSYGVLRDDRDLHPTGEGRSCPPPGHDRICAPHRIRPAPISGARSGASAVTALRTWSSPRGDDEILVDSARESWAYRSAAAALRLRASAKVTNRLRSSSHNLNRTARSPSHRERVGTSWNIGFSSCARCKL